MQHGRDRPLLLIHGLGGSWRSWMPVLDMLVEQRDVIAIDLPGFGKTPPLDGEVSTAALADAMTDFLRTSDLMGVDVVGSSMGDQCGHFPHWDRPRETVDLILNRQSRAGRRWGPPPSAAGCNIERFGLEGRDGARN